MWGEDFGTIFITAIAFALLGYVIYAIFSILIGSTRSFRDNIMLSIRGSGPVKEEYEKYFAGKFAYYDKLTDLLKVKFLLRVKNFVSTKEFESRGGLVITEEMKMLIGASAVQLTFGLDKYLFDHFSKIIIYPESYYSRMDDNYHMGETNVRGIIVFSWKDFQEGYDKTSDAFNVGLHEMSHALELEQALGSEYDFYFASYFEKWSLIAKEEFQNIRDERESFLRDYAGTNRQEFFAVCIEYFFEKGEEFKRRLPQIYYHLSVLLNQDPLADDGIVVEEPVPAIDTMREEVFASYPVFTSGYTLIDFDLLFFIFAVIAGLLISGGTGMPPLIGIIIMLGALFFYSISLFFHLNKFLIYDKYLVIKNVFGNISSIYPLSKIISFNFYSDRQGDFVTLLIPSKGRIKKYSHRYKMKDTDKASIRVILYQKQIPVK